MCPTPPREGRVFVEAVRSTQRMVKGQLAACGDVDSQGCNHGPVTRSESQISWLAPLVWDDEGDGVWEWDVGC